MKTVPLFLLLLLLSSSGLLAQQTEPALEPLTDVARVLGSAEVREALDKAMCDPPENQNRVMEVPNDILPQLRATGPITPIPGTDRSQVQGIVTIVELPGTMEQVDRFQLQGEAPEGQSVSYNIIEAGSDTGTRFTVNPTRVRLRENFSVGRATASFTAEVNVQGRAMVSLRITP